MPENDSTLHSATIALLVLLTGILGSVGLGTLTSRILKASNGRILILGYFALAILGVSVSIGPMVVLVYMFFEELKAGNIPLVEDYPLAVSICVLFYYGILWAGFRAGAGRTGGFG
ncbi:MAG: hypothetical protein QNI99_17485 [Woeseiaceae bacterium]|nr:hypothetical protein [Woeseiaceae bacterium]